MFKKSDVVWGVHPVGERSDQLRKYSYIDKPLVDSLLAQFGVDPTSRSQLKSLGLGTNGISAQFSEKTSITYEKKINELIESLRGTGSITGVRPQYQPYATNDPPPLVIESFLAKCFIFKSENLESLDIRSLKVWVSSPTVSLPKKQFDFSGSYLLLIEHQAFEGGYCPLMSGTSALRVLHDLVKGQKGADIRSEILGRFDRRSIDEKLIEIGGLLAVEKKIESLYAIRRMSNEQWHQLADLGVRVHDMIAYPLFIAEDI